ncbi:hypothetical protein [Pseudomonas sp. NPDC007930]|uniref:hypothetical protein n=1 Tax=Pseudomonas sp. NPDC007930 TaxID=3364417 RepID=UPI0036E26D71
MPVKASLLALCLTLAGAASAAPLADGNAWRGWDAPARHSYLEGAIDGAELGATIAVFGCNLQDADDARRTCNTSTIGAYRAGQERYLKPVGVEQLQQGLDTLYNEPLNRPIPLRAGLQAVVYQLGGLPNPEALIEAYRRRVGQP